MGKSLVLSCQVLASSALQPVQGLVCKAALREEKELHLYRSSLLAAVIPIPPMTFVITLTLGAGC